MLEIRFIYILLYKFPVNHQKPYLYGRNKNHTIIDDYLERTENFMKTFKTSNLWKRFLCGALSALMIFGGGRSPTVVDAETINHTHIWATKYDNKNHWEYCTVCGATRNTTAHTFTDHWINDKIAHCDGSNYSIRSCACGYSYKYRESHESSGWCAQVGQGLHFKYCLKCNHYLQTQRCWDKDGHILNCNTRGTCTVCGGVYSRPLHEINNKGICGTCGTHLLEIYNDKVTYSADHTVLTWTVTLKAASGHTIDYLGNAATGTWCVLGNWNWISHTRSDNPDGSITYTNVIKINEKFQEKGVLLFSTGGSIDGYTVMSINFNSPYYYWSDITAPVQNDIIQKDQASANDWATIKQLTLTGTENASDTVWLTIADKSTGEKYVTDAAVSVVDGKYSYTCTPSIEGDTNGRTYVVTAKDRIGNTSTKEFIVSKTDGSCPQLKNGTSLTYTDWTNTAKTITLTFTDYGSGGVQASLGDQIHYQACTKTADGKYQITYTFSDDITGTKVYPLYLKDALGNATDTKLTIGNIDKHTYSISYNLNNGKLSGQPTNYNVESSTFTLPTPTKTGYIFTGWTGSNGTAPQMTVTVNKGTRGNLSYTANWQVNSYKRIIKHWLWGFKQKEGNNPAKEAYLLKQEESDVNFGTSYILDKTSQTTVPNGMFCNDSFGTAGISGTWIRYKFGTTVIQKAYDMYFEYDYYPYDYKISYNLNGGTNSSTNPSTYNVLYGVTLANPSKTGSSFDGWHENMINSDMLEQYKYDDEVAVNGNSVTFYNTLNDNKLNFCAFQIWKDDKLWNGNGGYNQLAEFATPGARTSATYKHSLPSGKYYVRLKVNGSKQDRSTIMPLYLEQGKTYTMGYKVDSFTPEKAVISDIYFVSSDKVTGINEGCNAAFSSTDDLYAKLAKRRTGDISLVALWKYNPVSIKVPQILTGDNTGKSQFRVKCDNIVAGNIAVEPDSSFNYTQDKLAVRAAIKRKSSSSIIDRNNHSVVYDIITDKPLTAGCWQGNFNIKLTLTKG